jgi:hypothetical protein
MTVERLIQAARMLPPDELQQFAEALAEELELATDRLFNHAVANGKFDVLAQTAVAEHQAGMTKPLDEILDHR